MPANVQLVKGWFDETLPGFLAEHPEPVSFVHVDCDLYSSTKTVLDGLAPRMVAGTQIVLDDFMLEPGWQREEHRAFFEFVERERWRFEYTGYSAGFPSTSAAVVLTGRD
jgi:Macrocin-O-methyltransferase (TylF)